MCISLYICSIKYFIILCMISYKDQNNTIMYGIQTESPVSCLLTCTDSFHYSLSQKLASHITSKIISYNTFKIYLQICTQNIIINIKGYRNQALGTESSWLCCLVSFCWALIIILMIISLCISFRSFSVIFLADYYGCLYQSLTHFHCIQLYLSCYKGTTVFSPILWLICIGVGLYPVWAVLVNTAGHILVQGFGWGYVFISAG